MNEAEASINAELRELYSQAFVKFRDAGVDLEGVSGLHALVVPESYHPAKTKLMIVGQETRGWGNPQDDVETQLSRYVRFDLGKRFMRTPFWRNSHVLNKAVNEGGSQLTFLWSNLVKASRLETRPPTEVEELVSGLGLVQGEIRIARPDAVVFFTGPNYDARLRKTFPGVEYHSIFDLVYRLEHPDLPELAFRTYHPHYLSRSGNLHVIQQLAETIQGRTPIGNA